MNEIMKVLTLISTVFMPLTFLALMALVAVSMLFLFGKKEVVIAQDIDAHSLTLGQYVV